MEGERMNKLKRMFALTEDGVRGMVKAAVATFFVNWAYMAAIMLFFLFTQDLLASHLHSIWLYVAILAAVAVVMFLVLNLEYKRTYNATYEEAQTLRLDIADRLKALPLSYYSRHDLSDLAQTIMQDVLDLEHAMSHAIPQLMGTGVFMVLVIIVMLIGNPALGVAAAVPLLLSALIFLLSHRSQKRWTSRFFWKLRENSEIFQETIEMQQDIKSYGLGEQRICDVDRALEESERMHIQAEKKQGIPTSTASAVVKAALGTVIVVSAALLIRQTIDVLFVIGYIIGVSKVIDAVGAVYMNIAEVMYLDVRVKRINELRDTPIQAGKPVELKTFDIELEDVRFAYNDETQVVNGVSFVARQGEVTALVGPSGCGKTTILRLVSRLFDYDSGSIRIDGHDIRDISTESLYQNISMVFQDVTLFNASVMENIRVGRPGASDADVMAAARAANCEEFIQRMDAGYQTLIGENGSKLSGGERQRLSLARAFLKNAPILLLDEISASLDVENEMKIQDSLNRLIQNKTVIIVSHRLKSIENVDQIVVMNAGQVDRLGTHSELLEQSALYQKMIERSNLTERFTY